MFRFKSLQYTTALSLTLILSPIDSVSYAASSMEVKDSRVISSLLKPSSILLAKKSKKRKKPKKLTKAQRRKRARINRIKKQVNQLHARVAPLSTRTAKLSVIQDKENQLANEIARLNKRFKKKRVKKNAKRKIREQIRFRQDLLKEIAAFKSTIGTQQVNTNSISTMTTTGMTSRITSTSCPPRTTTPNRYGTTTTNRYGTTTTNRHNTTQQSSQRPEDRTAVNTLVSSSQSAHNFGDDVNKFSILTSLDRLNTRYSHIGLIDDNDLLQMVRDNLSAEFASHPKLSYALLVIDALQGTLTGVTGGYPTQYRSFDYSETSGSRRSYSLLKIFKLVWTGIIDDRPFGTSGPRQSDEDIKARKANLLNALYDIRFGYGDNGNPASVPVGGNWSCPNGAATRLVGSLDGGAHKDVLVIRNELIFAPFVDFMQQEFNRDPGTFQNVPETDAWNVMKPRLTRRAKEILFSDANSTRNLPNDVTQAIDQRCRQEFTSLLQQEPHSVQETVMAVARFYQPIYNEVEALNGLSESQKVEEAVRRLTAKMKEYRFGDANSTRNLEQEIVNKINGEGRNFFASMW